MKSHFKGKLSANRATGRHLGSDVKDGSCVRDDDRAKMAAAALRAELTIRDGEKQQISVKVQKNLRSLIAAVRELNASASRLLSELVEQEKPPGDFAQGGCDVTASITRLASVAL